MTEASEEQFDDAGSAAELAWLWLAERAFAPDWDNEQDAVYDNWKELYGLREGGIAS